MAVCDPEIEGNSLLSPLIYYSLRGGMEEGGVDEKTGLQWQGVDSGKNQSQAQTHTHTHTHTQVISPNMAYVTCCVYL